MGAELGSILKEAQGLFVEPRDHLELDEIDAPFAALYLGDETARPPDPFSNLSLS